MFSVDFLKYMQVNFAAICRL
ncbi:hypothetical protein PHAMO_210239 [Magnetospirillum molischianum DSM 120]|uniref:Uncharacterized protein n=1 Tax=Magnetospirillum molischianum DSM 120 TaxID=1150626 RepID=H8FQU0_MAGML|nr:hypothetical protein PHAMO_210239 [Magnetospirillum molischianum DSM 120]